MASFAIRAMGKGFVLLVYFLLVFYQLFIDALLEPVLGQSIAGTPWHRYFFKSVNHKP
jgi:hypothetical protein